MRFFFCFLFLFGLGHAQWEWEIDSSSCTTPDRKSGSCIPINDCQPMSVALDQVPRPIPPEIRKYLKEYQCGFEGRQPKICCPSEPIVFGQQQQNQENLPDVRNHRNLRLLPEACGVINTDNKIVNGEKTGLFEFPWMALLSYRTARGPQFKCGGSIINNKYILTAAHCLANLKSPFVGVRIGEHNINTQKDCEKTRFGEVCAPPYQDLLFEKVIIHPNYDAKHFTNDIALIRVSRMNLQQENTRSICLPIGDDRSQNFPNVIVTGWGITEQGRASPELLKVKLPVVALHKCQEIYGSVAKLNRGQICAGGSIGKDSCGGDSGGPMQILTKFNGDHRFIQQGVVSFGPSNCGKSQFPGVYTKVAAFTDWILDNLEP